MNLELSGKVALITGGTDGLGLALAKRLVDEGASVAVCGRDEERVRAAEAELREEDGDALALRADVTRLEDLEEFVDAAVSQWGRIDGIVHNAGRASAGAIESIDDATWEADFQLKLMAAVRLTRLALPKLREAEGSILFTLALAAKAPGGSSEPSSVNPRRRHGADEGALEGAGARWGQVQRGADRPDRERAVGASGPGIRADRSNQFYESFSKNAAIPLGRFGRAQEFADLGLFLALAPGVVPDRRRDQPGRRALPRGLRVRSGVVALGLGPIPRAGLLQIDDIAVDHVDTRQRVDMRAAVASPFRLGRLAGRGHVAGDHEHDFVVLAHAARTELASQVRREEVHAGQRSEYERCHES